MPDKKINAKELLNSMLIASKNVLKKVGNIIIKEMGDSNFNITRLIQYEPIGRIALEGKLTYLKTFNILGLDSHSISIITLYLYIILFPQYF